MAPAVSLSAEPAVPEVREQQNLPPKSFADAVASDEPALISSKEETTNGFSGTNRTNESVDEEKTLKPKSFADVVASDEPAPISGQKIENSEKINGFNGTNGSADKEKTLKPKASVLRITDTHPADQQDSSQDKEQESNNENKPLKDEAVKDSKKAEKKTKKNQTNKESKKDETPAEKDVSELERPIFDRQESKREYTAAGLDDTPKSPPRFKHRKQKSSSIKSGRSHNSSPEPTGPAHINEEKTEKFEKYQAEQNGSNLTSVKPTPEFEEALQRGKKERPNVQDRKLASGRQAGKRWETSAIRWAPLNVPLQRRLQTLVVLFHTLCIPLFVSSFFFLCAIPLFWPLLIPYMIYCIFSSASMSGTLSHRSDFLRSLPVWSLFASYFPARLHRSEELPPTRKYIFGYHPHGIISHGAFAAFGTEALGFSQLFPGIKNTLLTLDSNFRVPFYRDYALAMGLASVSKESCENLLSKGGPNREGMGRAITIVIGGAAESLDAQPHFLRLVLKRRKGFVKMAIKTGADLVPVLAFGENDLYDQVTSTSHPTIHKFQLLVKKILGFTIPLFHARGVFNYDVGLMPYRRPLNIVVGRPVRVAQSKSPQQEDIDRAHEEYVAELERLWDLWKDDFAKDREGELEILE